MKVRYVVLNMGCPLSSRITIYVVLPAVPKLQRVLLIQETVSLLPGSYTNHINMGPHLADLHQGHASKYSPVNVHRFVCSNISSLVGVKEASTGIVLLNLPTIAAYTSLQTCRWELVGHIMLKQAWLIQLYYHFISHCR